MTYFNEINKYLLVHQEPKRRYQKISKFFNISKLLAIRIITKEIPFSDLKTYLNQDIDHCYIVLFQNWLFKKKKPSTYFSLET